MILPVLGRRGRAVLAATVLLAGCAREPAAAQARAAPKPVAPQPVAAPVPRSSPECKKIKVVQGPLEPLTVVTSSGRTTFSVEIADSEITRERGLMCRRTLTADRGMLFDFHRPQADAAFWMKNTLIPLDIIYIHSDGRVLSIARDAVPLDETPLPAGGEVLGVLELAGGRAAQIGLMPGDHIEHRIFPRE